MSNLTTAPRGDIDALSEPSAKPRRGGGPTSPGRPQPDSYRGLKIRVLKEVFWRDVFYAILPLIVSLVVAALMGADFLKPLQSKEWLFAAIVLLGLSIAHMNQRFIPHGSRRERPQAAHLLLLVIVSSVLLGVTMYQEQTPNTKSRISTLVIASAQVGIFAFSFFNLWRLNFRHEKYRSRWEDSLSDNRYGPCLPADMPDPEIVANVQSTLEAARQHISLLGRAINARPEIAQVAAGDGEYWQLDRKNLQAQVANFIKEAEELRKQLQHM